MLSQVLLTNLRHYWTSCTEKPKYFLFPGRNINKPISPRTVEYLLNKASKELGIKKHVTAHILRHTFATHLLEEGVDVRKIQLLLGHRSLRTTQIYLHVASNYLSEIKSPLDCMPDLTSIRNQQEESNE